MYIPILKGYIKIRAWRKLEAIQTSEYDGGASSFNVKQFHFRKGILYQQKRGGHLV
jgi:hypothetical protein